jgi:uncharacterized membrane protein
MSGRLGARLQAVRSSYWFVPSLMALGAVLLGAGMIWLDVRLGTNWIEGISWYQQIGVDGAREVLSTIAGSMITVAGVVFSVTIVALSYASGQYGPRVLTNFMSDRGNTVTLGTFIATFLYCLAILRTIHGGQNDFVPQLSVLVALLLAICSIAVLIYFIHHVPQTIHINHVVARIGEQLVADTRNRFPALIGDEPSKPQELPGGPAPPWTTVRSDMTGYVQAIEQDRLLHLASDRDLLLRLRYRPGDFVMAGRGLVDVSPPDRVDDALCHELRQCFTAGKKRTPESDLMFLVSELVEIAARALSPGVNDPMTAVTCLDWLGAGGTEFAQRRLPAAVRVDDDGRPRVIATPISFADVLDKGFGRLRHYAAADMIAGLHFLRVLGEVAAACRQESQLLLIGEHAERFTALAADELSDADRRAVLDRAAELRQLLTREPWRIDEDQAEWLGGSA